MKNLLEKMSGENSFDVYQSLYFASDDVLTHIGLYVQSTSSLDLHLRRLYFGLTAAGADANRGPETATLKQLLERLPKAVERSPVELYRKKHFPRLIEVLAGLMDWRNDVVHSACRWDPRTDVLVFAHVNEKADPKIRTGVGVAYWMIERTIFLKRVRDLQKMGGYIVQYTAAWLPKLRPWLPSYFNGEPDPGGLRADQFFADVIRRNFSPDLDDELKSKPET